MPVATGREKFESPAVEDYNAKMRVGGGVIPPSMAHFMVAASLADAEFLRLPKPGSRCRVTGLSRTSLVELGAEKLIKLIRVRRPGKIRGTVLIERKSLIDFLRSCEAPDVEELSNAESEGGDEL